jgi:hypothetical protein
MLPTAVRGAAPQVFSKAAVQSGSRNLKSGCRKAALLQTCSPKLVFKASPESCSPSCRAKRLRKPPPQKQMSCAAPQRCAHSCPPKLLPESFDSAHVFTKNVPKAILQSGYRWPQNCYAWPGKLFPKAASKSCFLKLLPQSKAVFCSDCPSMLLQCREVSPNVRKLFFKALQSGCPKAAVPQNNSPHVFLTATPESCSQSCP